MKEFLKSHIKPFLQGLAFFLIFILIFLHVQNVFNLKGSGYTKYMYFEDEQENTIDVMYFGNSRCNRGVDPTVVDGIAGTYSYNMGIQGLRANHVYVRMQDALKTQSPKLIAIEISTFLPASNQTLEESYGHRTLMSMPMNLDRVFYSYDLARVIAGDKKDKADRAIEYFLPLLRFHSRYSELSAGDFVYNTPLTSDFDYDEKEADACILERRGYTIYTTDKQLEQTTEESYFNQDFSEIDDVAELDGLSFEYLEKIVAFARENGCELLFFSLPALSAKKSGTATIPIMNYLRACYGEDSDVKFLDAHDYIKKIGLDYQYYQNKEHLNRFGAEKFSKFLGEYIKENYNYGK